MVKLNELDLPVILEKKLLFGPGEWNGWNIEEDEVLKSLDNTKWDSKTRSLFYSHKDESAESWVGSISNEQLENGKVYGDLQIFDADLALKLTEGQAPFAVSAGIKWPAEFRDPVDFSYRNFSLVVNPGVHNEEIYINFAENKDAFNEAKFSYKEDANFAVVTAMEKKRKELGMSVSQFYAVPRDPPSESALPIFDAAHVRNALSRFEQTHLTAEEKIKAKAKIISAAKKFDIEVSADFNVEEDESNLEDERRLNVKMEEEKVENTKETEEVKVETEVKEDETKDAETKADFSEFKAEFETKLSEAVSRIKVLEEKQANFEESESESESKDEEKEEKEEVKEEEVEVKTEVKTEAKEDKTEADFKEIAKNLGRIATGLENKPAPMTTAEFAGNQVKKDSVTDRLTKALS